MRPASCAPRAWTRDAERALRGIALGRKSWLFAGADRGGERAAAMYTLIGTAKLYDVGPQAWLADVLDRIAASISAFSGGLLLWRSDQGESRASISARVTAAPADG